MPHSVHALPLYIIIRVDTQHNRAQAICPCTV